MVEYSLIHTFIILLKKQYTKVFYILGTVKFVENNTVLRMEEMLFKPTTMITISHWRFVGYVKNVITNGTKHTIR